MPKISKRVVDKIKPSPEGKDIFIWDSCDGSLKGFGIRVKPSGAATYLIQYRNQEGRTRRLALGKVGTLTPDEARVLARDKLASVSKGHDPSAERHAIRSSITVSELCELYLKDAAGRIKESTLKVDKIRVNAHVLPLLGKKTVRSLTRQDIEGFQNDIAVGKTAKPRPEGGRGGHPKGGRGAASRTTDMFTTILEFACNKGIIEKNPGRGVKKFASKKMARFLSIKEIVALGKVIKESETESQVGLDAINLLLLTGCRKSEILSLPWEWVDFDHQCIRFHDSKTGPQLRPISSSALNKLKEIKKRNDSSWVCPSVRGDGHFIGLPKVFKRFCTKAEIQNASLHTLRHTFSSVATGLGYTELTIAGMIGHKNRGVTARYAHLPDRALLAAANTVSARIKSALNGEKVGEVIQLNHLEFSNV